MTTIEIRERSVPPTVEPSRVTPMVRRALALCGIVSSLLYVVMNVVVPMQWERYSVAGQTVSELSAIGAPTRPLWVPLGLAYTLLVIAFGCGIWATAHRTRSLRIAGGLMVAHGVIGLAWPPMHQREVLAAGGGTLTDTMHIAWSIATVVLMLLAVAFAARAFGKRFRDYSIATIALLVFFGALTGVQGPRISANLPTPWIGVWERISIGVYMLWVVVLAVNVLRVPSAAIDEQSVELRQTASRIPQSTKTLGFWSAVLATVFSLTYDLAQVAEWLGWLGSRGGPESNSTLLGILVLLPPSLFLGSAFLVLVISVHHLAAPDRRIWSHVAIAFATAYATLISLVYFVQLTLVAPRLARGDMAGIEVFRFVPFDSFLYAVDILGYSFMSVATLFLARVFTGDGLQRLARWFLTANGLLLPFLALQMYVHPLIWVAALWAVTFPGSTWTLAILFRRGWTTEQVTTARA